MLTEEDRVKIVQEINQLSAKISQEKYLDRAKAIISEIKQETGQDFTNLITTKRGRYKTKDNDLTINK